MEQLPLFTQRFWTVTELTAYIRRLLEKEPATQDCWVKGEISNLSRPASGHIYFTLKDSNAYEVTGQYQLIVDAVQPVGEGYLFQEFLKLKARLEAEGLFDPNRKRPIPGVPKRIGIVTSATGAAIQDMLNTIRRRFPIADVILCPTPVQGVEAPAQIIKALQRVIREGKPDVVIIARGGGSLEDLWAFNDEQVVRAIADSSIPIVTGIGHETDFTLADFAADLRAPTPTAAAELVTPNRMDLIAQFLGYQKYLLDMLHNNFQQLSRDNKQQSYRSKLSSPLSKVQMQRQSLDDQLASMHSAVTHQADLRKLRLAGIMHRLNSVNPSSVLNRGYAIVTDQESGHIITSVQQVVKGDKINIRVKDGGFNAVAGEER
jgi:exodeoxyribonuclease VII large subunit